jgi:hypothetical protein
MSATSDEQGPQKPIINLDEDEQNADWLRILAQRRKPRPKPRTGK